MPVTRPRPEPFPRRCRPPPRRSATTARPRPSARDSGGPAPPLLRGCRHRPPGRTQAHRPPSPTQRPLRGIPPAPPCPCSPAPRVHRNCRCPSMRGRFPWAAPSTILLNSKGPAPPSRPSPIREHRRKKAGLPSRTRPCAAALCSPPLPPPAPLSRCRRSPTRYPIAVGRPRGGSRVTRDGEQSRLKRPARDARRSRPGPEAEPVRRAPAAPSTGSGRTHPPRAAAGAP